MMELLLKKACAPAKPTAYHISRETFLAALDDVRNGRKLEEYGLSPKLVREIRAIRYPFEEAGLLEAAEG